MKITLKWLNKHDACKEALEFFKKEGLTDHIKIAKKLLKLKKYGWLRWGISRALNKYNKIKFAIYCAEKVLPIYKDKYPEDDRLSKAIEGAKNYLNNPCGNTAAHAANAAANAAHAAYAADAANAIDAAYAAHAANAAANAAHAAARAEAANAAHAAARAEAVYAAHAAAHAAVNAEAVYAAHAAARAEAVYAAHAAVNAGAVYAVNAAVNAAAHAAANAAADAAADALNKKIIAYGLALIDDQEKHELEELNNE